MSHASLKFFCEPPLDKTVEYANSWRLFAIFKLLFGLILEFSKNPPSEPKTYHTKDEYSYHYTNRYIQYLDYN